MYSIDSIPNVSSVPYDEDHTPLEDLLIVTKCDRSEPISVCTMLSDTPFFSIDRI